MNEPRTQWRPLLFNILADKVSGCQSIVEAAQLVNQQLWGIFHVHYEPECTPDIMSPAEVQPRLHVGSHPIPAPWCADRQGWPLRVAASCEVTAAIWDQLI